MERDADSIIHLYCNRASEREARTARALHVKTCKRRRWKGRVIDEKHKVVECTARPERRAAKIEIKNRQTIFCIISRCPPPIVFYSSRFSLFCFSVSSFPHFRVRCENEHQRQIVHSLFRYDVRVTRYCVYCTKMKIIKYN